MVSLLLCLLLSVPSWAQGPRCATQYLKDHRPPFSLPAVKELALQQPAQISVGTPLQFYVFDSPQTLAPATCRYVGERAYIFVEDTQWAEAGGPLAQADVDTLGALFERRTPADPTRGIYSLDVETFGEPPDVDGDPRLFILLLDINTEGTIGFFDSGVATLALPELRRDTLYLDAPALRQQPYLARGTLAHEFQHLIHWGRDPDEERWVDEGLAGYAEEVAGYPEADSSAVPSFLRKPEVGLLWRTEAQAYNYGSTYLFMSFLAQRQGRDFIRELVAQPRNGTFGVDEAFASQGVAGDFISAWGQWVVGNYAGDARYGYAALQGRRVHLQAVGDHQLPLEEVEGQVAGQWGATYISFPEAGNLELEFSASGRFRVWAYAWQGGRGELQEVGLDEAGQGHFAAVGVDSLTLIAGRLTAQGNSFLLSARHFVPTLVEGLIPLPQRVSLGAGYPNPFNGYAQIPFELAEESEVELVVYNSLGQRLRLLREGRQGPGGYRVGWDGRDAAGAKVGSGTYTVVLQAGQARLSQRLSLVK